MNRNDLKKKLERFIKELKYEEKSSRTLSQYKHACNLFIESIDHENDITKDDVMDFKAKIIDEYKPSSVKNFITSLNKFLHYCEFGTFDRTKDKKSDLEVKQVKIQHVSSIENVLEPQEFKRLVRFAKKIGQKDMYLIMKIFAYTGIREQELKEFTVENIKKSVIKINSKGTLREIVLRGDLHREIKKYVKEEKIESGYIFRGVRDETKLISAKTIWWRLKKLAGMAKIKKAKVHAHSFRHLFTLQCQEQGMTVEEIADILGHKSTETTRIYLRSTTKMKKEKLEKLKY